MKTRLLLSGILLLSVLTACSDRNEEVEVAAPAAQKKVNVGVTQSEATRAVNDSVNKPTILDEANDKQEDPADTIDPTKPDRPK